MISQKIERLHAYEEFSKKNDNLFYLVNDKQTTEKNVIRADFICNQLSIHHLLQWTVD